MVGLGFLPGNRASRAFATNSDGTVVVGDSSLTAVGDTHGLQAFRWTQAAGMVGLGILPGDSFSTATSLTADGLTVVGSSVRTSPSGFVTSGQAFIWKQSTGMVGIGVVAGDNYSAALAINADGAVVVGTGGVQSGTGPFVSQRGFLWDQVFGMQDLRQVLITEYGLNVAGWQLTNPDSVSANGRTIAGFGTILNGLTQAFIISGILVNRLVNGTYVVAPGFNDAIGILGGSGTVQIGAGGSLSVAGNNLSSDAVNFPNSVFSGMVTGAGDLIKAGTGSWQFNGSFQSTGDVFINAGTLALAGAGASPVRAASLPTARSIYPAFPRQALRSRPCQVLVRSHWAQRR